MAVFVVGSTKLGIGHPPEIASDVVEVVVKAPLVTLVCAIFFYLLLLLACFEASRRWIGARAHRIRSNSRLSYSRFLDDVPIDSPDQDALGFGKIAKKWIDAIVVAPGSESLTFALTDDWGMGKSSMLRLMIHHANLRADRPIIITFNPWYLSDSKDIIESFTSSLFGAIRSQGPLERGLQLRNLESAIKSSLALLSPQSPASSLFSTWSDDTGSTTERIEASIKQADAIVRCMGRPVFFVIDDLDRLMAPNLMAVLMALKLFESIRGVTFVLALSTSHCAEELSDHGGERFLEKIIQKKLHLPPPSVSRLTTWMGRLIVKSGLATDEAAVNDLVRLILRSRALGSSPRRIVRLINDTILETMELRFHAPDALRMGILRTVAPSVFDDLKHRPGEYATEFAGFPASATHDYVRGVLSEMEDEEKKKESDLQAVLGLAPDDERELVRELLGELFPGRFGQPTVDDHSSDGKLAEYNNLLKYLTLGDTEQTFDTADVQALFGSTRERSDVIEGYAKRGRLEALLQYSLYCANESIVFISIDDPRESIVFFAELVANSESYGNIFEEVAFIIQLILKNQSGSGNSGRLASEFVFAARSLSLIERVLLNLARIARIWKSGIYDDSAECDADLRQYGLTCPELKHAIDGWVGRAVEDIANGVGVFRREANPISILYRVAQFSGRDELAKAALDSECSRLGAQELLRELAGEFRGNAIQGFAQLVSSDLKKAFLDELREPEFRETLDQIRDEFSEELHEELTSSHSTKEP